ncbi:hypothetical protein HPB50_006042 [Hyalomma asiaticum]|uniref:Uncharacterized protein n=1 Tax=Hyalomma asiaticum TaxID=266040 RepID=A0ACB7RHJ0_HYAAI|nr:hypothetical protein HPB50_006042 [Hyalomma asiaticum]
MTDKDVETVLKLLEQVSLGELEDIFDTCTAWIPQKCPSSQENAIIVIRSSLLVAQCLKERLHRVALLYSGLVPTGVIRAWTLYRVNLPAKQIDQFAFIRQLSKKMNCGDFQDTTGFTGSLPFVCCSVLLSDDESATVEHNLVCFYMWYGRAFLAVHASGATARNKTLREALATVHVDPDKCLHGHYDELSAAQAEVLQSSVA